MSAWSSSDRPADGGLAVLKGHGTENDFIVIPDLAGDLDLGVDLVRALCDRRAGIGADGVLRVVRSAATAAATGEDRPGGSAEFFMDYRNADGSMAEMCGNGLRVYVRYLIEAGLVAATGPVAVGTRGGIRTAWVEPDGQITVDLGAAGFPDTRPTVALAAWAEPRAARAVSMPNPHIVVAVADPEELAALDLSVAPRVDPARPGGQNVEFVCRLGPLHLAMRVHERGVGETRSCGTGIAAAALAAMAGWLDGAPGGVATDEVTGGDPASDRAGSWRVDVPGGTCRVRVEGDGSVLLTGPAVLVARVEVDAAWLSGHRIP